MSELVTSLVLVALITAIIAVAVWLLSKQKSAAKVVMSGDGFQEVEITVKGRYHPDTVVVKSGVPVRLLFNRQEDAPCSERVIFSAFQQERWLPPFVTTPVEFIPTRAGDFLFTCAQGMYQGRLLVEEPRPAKLTGRFAHGQVLGFRSSGTGMPDQDQERR